MIEIPRSLWERMTEDDRGSSMSSMPEPQTLLTDLVIGESPRWHDGRLWFAHWGAGEIVAVDVEGAAEVVGPSPVAGLGGSIDWLPHGQLLVTGQGLQRREAAGSGVNPPALGAPPDSP